MGKRNQEAHEVQAQDKQLLLLTTVPGLLTQGSSTLMLRKPKASSLGPKGRALLSPPTAATLNLTTLLLLYQLPGMAWLLTRLHHNQKAHMVAGARKETLLPKGEGLGFC